MARRRQPRVVNRPAFTDLPRSPLTHAPGVVVRYDHNRIRPSPAYISAPTRADLITALRLELHFHVPGDGFLAEHTRPSRNGRPRPVLNDVQVLRAGLETFNLLSRRPSVGGPELTAW